MLHIFSLTVLEQLTASMAAIFWPLIFVFGLIE